MGIFTGDEPHAFPPLTVQANRLATALVAKLKREGGLPADRTIERIENIRAVRGEMMFEIHFNKGSPMEIAAPLRRTQ